MKTGKGKGPPLNLSYIFQSEYSSAWVPPTPGMGSGKEETCVKSSAQVPTFWSERNLSLFVNIR